MTENLNARDLLADLAENLERGELIGGGTRYADLCAMALREVLRWSPAQAGEPKPVACVVDLSDHRVVHLNMARGSIAKLTPAQIGHLYRGDEAKAVIAEIIRQNPEAKSDDPDVVRLVEALVDQHGVYEDDDRKDKLIIATPDEAAKCIAEAYKQAVRDVNRMRDDGTLPASLAAKEGE